MAPSKYALHRRVWGKRRCHSARSSCSRFRAWTIWAWRAMPAWRSPPPRVVRMSTMRSRSSSNSFCRFRAAVSSGAMRSRSCRCALSAAVAAASAAARRSAMAPASPFISSRVTSGEKNPGVCTPARRAAARRCRAASVMRRSRLRRALAKSSARRTWDRRAARLSSKSGGVDSHSGRALPRSHPFKAAAISSSAPCMAVCRLSISCCATARGLTWWERVRQNRWQRHAVKAKSTRTSRERG